jgi:N utilization substance protein B
MRRNEARELLMQLFFEMDAQGEFTEEIKNRFFEEYAGGSEQKDYLEKAAAGFLANKDEIDSIIEGASEKWHINRMAKIDLAVLRLAVCEMKFAGIEDVPVSVAINEAVALSKKYGTADSPRFVNGILGKISRDGSKDSAK